MSKADRTNNFYSRMKTSLVGIGASISEARRRQAEFHRRFPGAID